MKGNKQTSKKGRTFRVTKYPVYHIIKKKPEIYINISEYFCLAYKPHCLVWYWKSFCSARFLINSSFFFFDFCKQCTILLLLLKEETLIISERNYFSKQLKNKSARDSYAAPLFTSLQWMICDIIWLIYDIYDWYINSHTFTCILVSIFLFSLFAI